MHAFIHTHMRETEKDLQNQLQWYLCSCLHRNHPENQQNTHKNTNFKH